MWKRKRKKEWLPWYRAPDYKGDLTEAEKRQLDAFRTQEKHPAASADRLPEEVREYINHIEFDIFDRKQQEATGWAAFYTLVVAVYLVLNYTGCVPHPTNWAYLGGALFLAVVWWDHKRKQDRISEDFLPSDREAVPSRTDEGIRFEWELNYIGATREQQREGESVDNE